VRKLVLLLLIGLAGYLGYRSFVAGENPLAGIFQIGGGLPARDASGRELTPCRRCLATGKITCSGSRCEGGQVPCPGRCLKLTDRGWRRVDGQPPDKLFMVYPVNGGTRGVSQAHVGEIFEVRFGKLLALGVCKICNKQTVVPCKVCSGGGKLVCPACQGEKVVLKTP
jgi:hypothetical protein